MSIKEVCLVWDGNPKTDWYRSGGAERPRWGVAVLIGAGDPGWGVDDEDEPGLMVAGESSKAGDAGQSKKNQLTRKPQREFVMDPIALFRFS